MLTKTYPLDEAGGWQRRFADFTEDVVVVCADCGTEPTGTFVPAGSFGGDGTSFAFVPSRVAGSDQQADESRTSRGGTT